MAIFVVMAWTMELAEWIGFLKTEPPDSRGRAYKLAHEACQWLREQLAQAEVVEVTEGCVTYLSPKGNLERIEVKKDRLIRSSEQRITSYRPPLDTERFQQPMLDRPHPLGPGGAVTYELVSNSLSVQITATDERNGDRGAHSLSLRLQVRRAG